MYFWKLLERRKILDKFLAVCFKKRQICLIKSVNPSDLITSFLENVGARTNPGHTNPRQYKPKTHKPQTVPTSDSTNPRQNKPRTGTNPGPAQTLDRYKTKTDKPQTYKPSSTNIRQYKPRTGTNLRQYKPKTVQTERYTKKYKEINDLLLRHQT